MTQVNRIFSALLVHLRRFAGAVKSQPFGLLSGLSGIAAAILAVTLPWAVPGLLDDLSLAVAKRLAGTGVQKLAPISASALALLGKTALAAVLYLAAIWCALRCARQLRGDLRTAVNAGARSIRGRGSYAAARLGEDVGRDIDHISAMVAAAPEWLMVAAGMILCVMLLVRAPILAAIWIPVTALAVCAVRDILRRQRVSPAIQTVVMASLWSAGTLMMLLRAIQTTEPGISLGMLVLLLLGMALIVPAALQAPYRNSSAAWEAYQRVRGILKINNRKPPAGETDRPAGGFLIQEKIEQKTRRNNCWGTILSDFLLFSFRTYYIMHTLISKANISNS